MDPPYWSVSASVSMLMMSLGMWILSFTTHFWATQNMFSIGFFQSCAGSVCSATEKDGVLYVILGFMCAGFAASGVSFLYTLMLVCKYRTTFIMWGAVISAYCAAIFVLAGITVFAVKLAAKEGAGCRLSWSWYMALCTDGLLFASAVCLNLAGFRWDFRYTSLRNVPQAVQQQSAGNVLPCTYSSTSTSS